MKLNEGQVLVFIEGRYKILAEFNWRQRFLSQLILKNTHVQVQTENLTWKWELLSELWHIH